MLMGPAASAKTGRARNGGVGVGLGRKSGGVRLAHFPASRVLEAAARLQTLSVYLPEELLCLGSRARVYVFDCWGARMYHSCRICVVFYALWYIRVGQIMVC